CPLEGLHRTRVVVAFDLKHHCLPVPNIKGAGPFPRPLHHARPIHRKSFEKGLGVFVAAVFRPHDTVDPQFCPIGETAQIMSDHLKFLEREPHLPEQLLVPNHLRSRLFFRSPLHHRICLLFRLHRTSPPSIAASTGTDGPRPGTPSSHGSPVPDGALTRAHSHAG